MSISVVVPSTLTNPSCELALASVVSAARTVPDAEVIVVANGPGPRRNPPALADRLVRVVDSHRPGPSAARNVGLRAARHPIVLFTDDDCLVPPTWCADLAAGLRRAGTAAAAAPVDVLPAGPVTAFLNHQRIFHAPALDATRVKFPLTAACAVDRTRTDAVLDERFLEAAGEDAEFGYRIRDGGGEIAWLDVPPVVQLMVETVDQVSQRFLAYGRGCALLFLGGRAAHAMPYAHIFYGDLCTGSPAARRRLRQFRELPDRAAGALFADLELVVEAATLAGYLAGLGEQLGHPLVDLDREALRDGWRRVFDAPDESTVDWADLRPDLALLGGGGEPEPGPNRHRQIGELLRAHAALRALSPESRAILETHGLDPELVRANENARALASSLSGATIAEADRALRAAGVPFGYGMLQLEQALSQAPRSVPVPS